jgi:ribosomal protein L29
MRMRMKKIERLEAYIKQLKEELDAWKEAHERQQKKIERLPLEPVMINGVESEGCVVHEKDLDELEQQIDEAVNALMRLRYRLKILLGDGDITMNYYKELLKN